jgi:hypothetical protein
LVYLPSASWPKGPIEYVGPGAQPLANHLGQPLATCLGSPYEITGDRNVLYP